MDYGRGLPWGRRVALTALVGGLIALQAGCAVPWAGRARDGAPPPTVEAGVPDVAYRDIEWLDVSRQRVVPARLYLPPGWGPAPAEVARDRDASNDRSAALAGAPGGDDTAASWAGGAGTGTAGGVGGAAAGAAGGPGGQRWPLVVFSHGLGGSRYGYSHLGRYWASQGIATLHLQHDGSDRAVWSAQGLAVLSALRAAATPDQAIARVQDVHFALDQVLADPEISAHVDPARIGVAGHSFGANTSLLAIGARIRGEDRVLSYADPRIRAAVVLSPPALPDGYDAAFFYSGIRVPTLHLTGTMDSTMIPGAFTMPEDRRVPFDSMTATPRYLGVFELGRHSMFNDRSRDATSRAIKQSTRELTLAFWRSVFEQDATATARLTAAAHALPEPAGPLAVWEAQR